MPDDRTESLRIRVSPAEKKAMQNRAEAANVTVSELVREALLGRSDLAIASAASARREGQPPTSRSPGGSTPTLDVVGIEDGKVTHETVRPPADATPEQRLDWMREQRERNLAQAN